MDARDNPIAVLDRSSIAVADSVGHRLFGAVDSTRPYRATIHLKGRKEVLPVSRSYLHRFRQM